MSGVSGAWGFARKSDDSRPNYGIKKDQENKKCEIAVIGSFVARNTGRACEYWRSTYTDWR